MTFLLAGFDIDTHSTHLSLWDFISISKYVNVRFCVPYLYLSWMAGGIWHNSKSLFFFEFMNDDTKRKNIHNFLWPNSSPYEYFIEVCISFFRTNNEKTAQIDDFRLFPNKQQTTQIFKQSNVYLFVLKNHCANISFQFLLFLLLFFMY